jgi:hypothetical protein
MKIITARSDSTLTQDQIEFLEQFLTPEELAELKAERLFPSDESEHTAHKHLTSTNK